MLIASKILFYFGLLLIQLPPFFLTSSWINTHTLAKIIFVFIFFYHIFYNKNKKEIFLQHKFIITIFLLFFISQSISIIYAVNIRAFLERYQNFLFSSLFFFLAFFYLRNKNSLKKIIYILFFGFFINFLFQFLIYFDPLLFSKIGYMFIHSGYMDLIVFNIQRGRVYFESYDEILIPVVFYYLTLTKSRSNKISLISFYFIIGFFSLVSNFRTKFLMLVFATFTPFILFIKNLKKYLLISIVLFLIFLYSVNKFQILSSGFSVFERFALEPQTEDYSTVTSRIDRWKKSVEIGMSSPITGVGLGNYYDYLSLKEQKNFSTSSLKEKHFELATQYPHNIFFTTFAETGFFGLISFTLLIFYFLKQDLTILFKRNNKLTISFIISFWTLFIFALFNPSITIKYQSLFWLLRILEIEIDSISYNQTALAKQHNKQV